MSTSIYFLIATAAIWYFLVTLFNFLFLVISGRLKEFSYKKIFVLSLVVFVFYLLANFISIGFFTYSIIPLVVSNIILVFLVGLIGSSRFVFNEIDRPLVYAFLFTFFLNILWYKLFGAL